MSYFHMTCNKPGRIEIDAGRIDPESARGKVLLPSRLDLIGIRAVDFPDWSVEASFKNTIGLDVLASQLITAAMTVRSCAELSWRRPQWTDLSAEGRNSGSPFEPHRAMASDEVSVSP